MTPANIAGMAMLNGLNIVALTDHNSARNCPAFFHHAKQYGIIPIPGMEGASIPLTIDLSTLAEAIP